MCGCGGGESATPCCRGAVELPAAGVVSNIGESLWKGCAVVKWWKGGEEEG